MENREREQGRSKGKSRQPLTFKCILAYECQIEVFGLFFSFREQDRQRGKEQEELERYEYKR